MLLQSIQRRLSDASPKSWPLKVVDAGLIAVLGVAPLFYGGRHDLGLFVYGVIVLLTAIAWAVHLLVNRSKAGDLCSLALTLLVAAPMTLVLQMLPLPAGVWRFLSPALAERLTVWQGGAGSIGQWNTLSVDVWSTRASLATLLAHCVLFLVVAARLQKAADVRRLLSWVGIAAAGMSVLALLQYASGTKMLLWCVALPYRDASRAALGSFTTPNHCGHFIALGAGAIVLMAFRQRQAMHEHARRKPSSLNPAGVSRGDLIRLAAAVGAIAATGLAVLLTFSRGALLSYLLGLCVTLALLARAGWIGRAQLVRVAFLVVVSAIGLSAFQYDRVSRESGGVSLSELELVADTTDRHSIWSANLAAFAANPLLGYGAGSHSRVYPMFLSEPSGVEYTHAESGYLQVATEAGLVGVLLLAAALLLVGGWCVRGLVCGSDREELALWAVIAAALAVSVVHSIADFVWFIPSCLAPVVMMAAAAMRLHRLSAFQVGRPAPVPFRLGLVGVGAATACVLMLAAPASTALVRDHWKRTTVALDRYNASLYAKARLNQEDADERILASRIYYADSSIQDLISVVRSCPRDAAAQVSLANECLLRFELAQAQQGGGIGFEGVRAAAMDSGFESKEAASEWLRRAFGEDARLLLLAHHAASNAVRLCPLQGEAYACLADLRFLAGPNEPAPEGLVEQAILVRPHNGGVLFTAGKYSVQAGRQDQALEYWRKSGATPGDHQVKLASVVSALMPASYFVEQFQPDWRFTFAAYEFYRRRSGGEEDLRVLASHATKLAKDHEAVDSAWHAALNYWQAAAIHEQLGDLPRAVECATRAYEIEPRRFHIRRGLASALYRSERFNEADPHIRWCLARRPDDQVLRHWLQDIAKRRLSRFDSERPARVAGRTLLGDREESSVPQPERRQ